MAFNIRDETTFYLGERKVKVKNPLVHSHLLMKVDVVIFVLV